MKKIQVICPKRLSFIQILNTNIEWFLIVSILLLKSFHVLLRTQTIHPVYVSSIVCLGDGVCGSTKWTVAALKKHLQMAGGTNTIQIKYKLNTN